MGQERRRQVAVWDKTLPPHTQFCADARVSIHMKAGERQGARALDRAFFYTMTQQRLKVKFYLVCVEKNFAPTNLLEVSMCRF